MKKTIKPEPSPDLRPPSPGSGRGQGEGPLDIADRRRAAGDLDKNLLVLAGAGTGKTTLLVDRLALLIVGQGMPVERIVALTFTKKAAEEMRVRLEEILRRLIASLEEEAEPMTSSLLWPLLEEKFYGEKPLWAARAKKALNDIPKAQIGTIHSFAGYLLRLYPLQSKVDPRFLEDEGSLADQALDAAWTPWILSEFAETNQQTALWQRVLADASLNQVKELCHLLLSPRVNASRLDEFHDLKPLAAAAQKELQSLLAVQPIKKAGTSFASMTVCMQGIFETVAAGGKIDGHHCENVLESYTMASDWKKQPGHKEAFERLQHLAEALARVDNEAITRILHLVKPFVDKVRRDLDRRGCVSFDGLLVLARNLVRDHALVRRALKKQFDAFLIDEFQDTDPLQGEILFYLAESPEESADDWPLVTLTPGRLFVVGDPKQSIYRFRGADMAAFAAFAEKLLENGEEAELSHNFRSQKPILDFVNTLTPLLMKPEAGFQPPYNELVTSSESSDPAVNVLRVASVQGDRSADALREAEGIAIATWIKNSGRPFGDFTLLFRSTSVFRFYLDALQRANIPYLAEGEKYFYHTPETVEFMALLSSIHNPLDRIALVGVLRSPVGSLNDRELFDLHKADSLDYSRSPRVLKEKLAGVFQALRTLHNDSRQMALGEFLEKVLVETRFLWLASRSLQGDQAVANIQKILLLAKTWSDQEPLSLGDFLARFRRYREEEKEEGENPLSDLTAPAVKVMTIHKAKGLEFPVVILPDLHRKSRAAGFDPPSFEFDWRTGRQGLRVPGSRLTNSAMVLNELDAAKREAAEEVRVFYVAMTRAKDQLTWVVSDDAASGVYANFLSKLSPLPKPGVDAWTSSALTVPVQNAVVDLEKDSKRSAPSQVSKTAEPAIQKLADLWSEREKAMVEAQASPLMLSPTHLMAEAEPEKRTWAEEEPEAVTLARDRARLLGEVVHKVLEEWNFTAKHSGVKLGAAVMKAGRVFELNSEVAEDKALLAEAIEILEGFLTSPQATKLKTVKIIGREVPFVYSDERGTMHGFIDLLYEDESGLVVADYKTTKVKGDLKKAAAKYDPQSVAYREAVSRVLKKPVRFEVFFLRSV